MADVTILTAAKTPPRPLISAPVVLLVDDEPTIQDVMTRLLRAHGLQVHQAMSVAESIRVAMMHHIDCAILDMRLHGAESGLDVLVWLRAQPEYAYTPVLILSGRLEFTEEEDVLIRRHGAIGFHKPQSFPVLVACLKRMMAEQDPHRHAA